MHCLKKFQTLPAGGAARATVLKPRDGENSDVLSPLPPVSSSILLLPPPTAHGNLFLPLRARQLQESTNVPGFAPLQRSIMKKKIRKTLRENAITDLQISQGTFCHMLCFIDMTSLNEQKPLDAGEVLSGGCLEL